ncbi:hypothetical protein [Longimicrobium terrae]|uniref:Uncharacterized protein n=1 Tax=Longimicrobium terrae TaxID=1639882 RepID=A0A841GZS7_9BACT|nr:hypothetical protein [Longimicrobium terrae]MBB4636821.1 hypothetical protein [Longimicrobium terrae]MBB6071179.1 hypothetical protein [Longimicrobium terrae]NNC29228.1 hypothetical protein [Longimicrobium terrae]
MYRNCIFCSAALGSNDAVERFPVGRTLAFDGEKGRLWAVCRRCARWNLAPLEERWEAIEDAERLFRDTRLRVQSENIGVAKLRDGTRLIRVGEALAGEVAALRYGSQIASRNQRAMVAGGAATVIGLGVAVAGFIAAPIGVVGAFQTYHFYKSVLRYSRGLRTVGIVDSRIAGEPARVRLRRSHLKDAWFNLPDDGLGIALHLPFSVEEVDPSARGPVQNRIRRRPLVLRGDEARSLMSRALVHVNVDGAPAHRVHDAAEALHAAGSAAEYLNHTAHRRLLLNGGDPRSAAFSAPVGVLRGVDARPDPVISLALEMALHEESERRAMEGELSALEAMWREAEQIAAIADRLPDIPASDPPRLGA